MNHLRRSHSLGIGPALTLLVLALAHCSGGSGGSSRVGDPCVLADESDPAFAGSRLDRESIETGAPECGGGVCLVNHFQGRVSCPLGQPEPRPCDGPDDEASCASDEMCVVTEAPPEPAPKRYVCHRPGSCQVEGASGMDNRGAMFRPKDCCVPGTDTPVSVSVCGQCNGSPSRAPAKKVYCSCRCGPPDGVSPAPDDTFCDCASGFQCSQIRGDLGLGDPRLRGKYCIREGTGYVGNSVNECGQVNGSCRVT